MQLFLPDLVSILILVSIPHTVASLPTIRRDRLPLRHEKIGAEHYHYTWMDAAIEFPSIDGRRFEFRAVAMFDSGTPSVELHTEKDHPHRESLARRVRPNSRQGPQLCSSKSGEALDQYRQASLFALGMHLPCQKGIDSLPRLSLRARPSPQTAGGASGLLQRIFGGRRSVPSPEHEWFHLESSDLLLRHLLCTPDFSDLSENNVKFCRTSLRLH